MDRPRTVRSSWPPAWELATPFRESRRVSPSCRSGPWQETQRVARTGRISVSKNASFSAVSAARARPPEAAMAKAEISGESPRAGRGECVRSNAAAMVQAGGVRTAQGSEPHRRGSASSGTSPVLAANEP